MERQLLLKKQNKRNALYVRFSEEEMNTLKKVSQQSGVKPQALVKQALFKKGLKEPIMNHENSLLFIKEIKRIGVNINQIAKQLNSGFRSGWSDSVERCREELTILRRELLRHVSS